ncbi:SMI1/KNR4 family protein [Thalassomonas viridans]|uniref:SMI1/KNR4 family protein n=1 Tax=Thalassomonas viridans TaxID=137584 RepID=A0AAF0CDA9_9GAMM|nr:SMI1/KNR4 family protein [Thalassomonas viridans]WDE09013.1 SMI1/KNR4 family protein [Thalassomonas viridans]
MNFDEFKKLVERKKSRNPIWFAMDADELPNTSLISEVENKLGAKLPVDYINFICEFGGGYFAFSNVFSLDENSDWNILEQNYSYDAIRKDHVLLSENGTGDFYGYKIDNGLCLPKIRFFDHGIQEWSDTEFSNIFEYLAKFALTN